jgi:hypothetical protein
MIPVEMKTKAKLLTILSLFSGPFSTFHPPPLLLCTFDQQQQKSGSHF